MIKYTVIFFVFAHSDVNKSNTHEQQSVVRSQVKEFYHLVSRKILVNQSMFCSEFSSTLLVPFAVLGTPTEGYQKSGTVHYFGTVHHF